MDELSEQLEALKMAGTPEETISMLQDIYEEHPDAASIVLCLLGTGWTLTPSGEQVICLTLRSPQGDHEVLGLGPTRLDAFEAILLKTKNFSSLLSGVEI